MHWGLSRGPTGPLDPGDRQGPVRHLYLYVPSDLQTRAQTAAAAAGVKLAPWLCHLVRRVTITDFPASWQEATPAERSHESRTYGTRFMLRLDGASHTKLQRLTQQCGASKAEIIRQLIAHATPEDVPPRWQMKTAARRVRPAPAIARPAMRHPRLDAADGNPQADDSPPPLPADREACLDLAVRALGQEIRAYRELTPAPSGAGESTLEDHD
jgi:hypothetical protein